MNLPTTTISLLSALAMLLFACSFTRANSSKRVKDVSKHASFLSSGVDKYSANNTVTLAKKGKSPNSAHTMDSIKKNNFRVTALIGKTITLTCSIELNDLEFSKSGNYKVNRLNVYIPFIWTCIEIGFKARKN